MKKEKAAKAVAAPAAPAAPAALATTKQGRKALARLAQAQAAHVAQQAAPAAPAAPAIVAGAKLTRRNTTPSTALLRPSGKVVRLRAKHVEAAWHAIVAACAKAPQPAAELAALEVFKGEHQAALVSGPAYVSYMQRRGYLVLA